MAGSPFLLGLGRYAKQVGDEGDLPGDVAFGHVLHLPLADHMHALIALQRSPSRFHRKEAHPRLVVHLLTTLYHTGVRLTKKAMTFELLGRPLIRKLQGHSRLHKPQTQVVVADGIHKRALRRRYARAHVVWQNDHFVAHITGNQGSHRMSSLLHANALVIIPEGEGEIHPGDKVKAILLDWPEA